MNSEELPTPSKQPKKGGKARPWMKKSKKAEEDKQQNVDGKTLSIVLDQRPMEGQGFFNINLGDWEATCRSVIVLRRPPDNFEDLVTRHLRIVTFLAMVKLNNMRPAGCYMFNLRHLDVHLRAVYELTLMERFFLNQLGKTSLHGGGSKNLIPLPLFFTLMNGSNISFRCLKQDQLPLNYLQYKILEENEDNLGVERQRVNARGQAERWHGWVDLPVLGAPIQYTEAEFDADFAAHRILLNHLWHETRAGLDKNVKITTSEVDGNVSQLTSSNQQSCWSIAVTDVEALVVGHAFGFGLDGDIMANQHLDNFRVNQVNGLTILNETRGACSSRLAGIMTSRMLSINVERRTGK